MKPVFGPIYSGPFGRTLCVDLVASYRKHCYFDCVYCPSQRASLRVYKRRWFVGISAIQALLELVEPSEVDCVAFTGTGEPTLASNLPHVIGLVRKVLHRPVVVFTNSSLICRDDVQRDLAWADTVVAKLDAPNERLFKAINGSRMPHSWSEVVSGLREFSNTFRTELVLQMTFVEANKCFGREMADIAREIAPSKVQLNTPWPCSIDLSKAAEMEVIRKSFVECNLEQVPATDTRVTVGIKQPLLSRANTTVMLSAFAA